jgi:hypothetical protein
MYENTDLWKNIQKFSILDQQEILEYRAKLVKDIIDSFSRSLDKTTSLQKISELKMRAL